MVHACLLMPCPLSPPLSSAFVNWLCLFTIICHAMWTHENCASTGISSVSMCRSSKGLLHIRIFRSAGGGYGFAEPYHYSSVLELVLFYTSNSLNRHNWSLPADLKLEHPLLFMQKVVWPSMHSSYSFVYMAWHLLLSLLSTYVVMLCWYNMYTM